MEFYEIYNEITEITETIKFYHDIASETNRKKRRNKALKWRKDRNVSINRYPFVDK